VKLAVFSDSHGRCDGMLRAIRAWSPDLILHLGDHSRDAAFLKEQFPQTPLRAVRGNCDPASDIPEADFFLVGSVPVFMTHGHRYGVKTGLTPLLNAAHFSGARLVLFGHTHRAENFQTAGMYVLNPGPAGDCAQPSGALVELDEAGTVSCRILPL
jgi:putative phosphoesterase